MPLLPIITASVRAIETRVGQLGANDLKQVSPQAVLLGLGLLIVPLQLAAENEDQDRAAIDLILTAERMYTSTQTARTVEAVGVVNDKIALVGSKKEVTASACGSYKVLSFEKKEQST